MTKRFCILQVEDDENDVYLLRHAFKSAGIQHPLQVVRDGQEAIDYLSGAGEFCDRTRYPLPCLVILDFKMPRKTGLEVLEWIRGHSDLPHVPVVVLSSSARAKDIERCYAFGANSFVVKPSSVAKRVQLAEVIKVYWLGFNEPPASCREL